MDIKTVIFKGVVGSTGVEIVVTVLSGIKSSIVKIFGYILPLCVHQMHTNLKVYICKIINLKK